MLRKSKPYTIWKNNLNNIYMERKAFIRILSVAFLLTSFAPQIAAQNDYEEYKAKIRKDFNQFQEKTQNEFNEYRKKINREFAEFLSKNWEHFNIEKPVKQDKPEPPKPVIAPQESNKEKPTIEIPVNNVVKKEKPKSNKPIDFPAELPYEEDGSSCNSITSFPFYGEQITFSLSCKTKELNITNTDENTISNAWKQLSSEENDIIIKGCVYYSEKYKLNDWGIFKLVESFTKAHHLGDNINNAYVEQAYILSQLGYDARIYRTGNKLGIMIPVEPEIADYKYLKLDGKKFYLFGPSGSDGIYTYDRAFEGATKSLNLYRKDIPVVGKDEIVQSNVFASKKYPEISCSTKINKGLMDFYNDIPPVLDYTYYVQQPCDNETMDNVCSVLRNAITGKSELQAVNMILDFVQQGFKYETDDKQFGREKYNFPEETFYYKACDCDDRAILFSTLVRELTKLDVVLIEYPNHLATAVKFNTQVSGDYVTVQGNKYFICDPTYIGASAGMSMPTVDTSKLRVYQIWK